MYGEAYPVRGGAGDGVQGGHLNRFLPKWSGVPKGAAAHYNSHAAPGRNSRRESCKEYGEEI